MLNIYIDTALLAVPNYANDHTSAQSLIDRINHFSLLSVSSINVRTVVSSDIEDKLISGYPTKEDISQFLEMMDLSDHYSPNDLIRQYHTVIQRSTRSDDIGMLEAVTVSDFFAIPSLPEALFPADLRDETERVLVTVGLQKASDEVWRVGSSFGTLGETSHVLEGMVASVKGGSFTAPELPIQITDCLVQSIGHLSDLISLSAAYELWRAANEAEDFHLAIAIGALALAREGGAALEAKDLLPFRIGSGFSSSLRDHQCAGSGRFSSATFQLCCQLVAKCCNREVKPMGRPTQLVRSDGLAAWRIHLTKDALALRLMTWSDHAVTEFANVGVKHALVIDQGRAGSNQPTVLSDFL